MSITKITKHCSKLITNSTYNTISACFSHGQKHSGVNEGAISLCNIVTDTFLSKKELVVTPCFSNSNKENEWKKDYSYLCDVLSKHKKYVLIGGDHSIGQSSVGASISKISDVSNLYVVWIDAHADTNTMEASLSKNLHGQPLAGILGFEEPWFRIKSTLPVSNLLYFGIRDLDQFEKEKITEHNIFNTLDLIVMLKKLKSIKDTNPNAKFHVSFDVDALDREFMTSTGCVVKAKGLHPSDVSEVINFVFDEMIALDIVEYNPRMGNFQRSYNSIKLILDNVQTKKI